MEYKEFEKHLSDTLYSDEVTLDIQGLINDIHGKKKKDRKLFILWFLGVALMVSTSAVSYNYFSGHNSDSIKNAIISNALKYEHSHQTVTTDVPTKNDIQKTTPKIKKTISQNISENIISRSNAALTYNKNVLKQYNQISNVRIAKEDDHFISFVEERRDLAKNINLLETPDLKNIDHLQERVKNDKIICPTFGKKNKIQIEIIPEIGMFLPMKKLENLTGESNSIYGLRNRDEKTLEGINAGLYIQLRKEKRPLYFKAGVSWSKLTERMPLQYAYSRKDTTQGIISITYSQTGDTITTIIGDIVTERRLSGNKTKHHAISMVDLPIGLGLEKNFGRWFAGVEAGIVVNLSMKSTGTILATDTSFVDVNTPNDHFKPAIGLSYFGGVLFGRDFNRGGRLFLAARARFIPDTFNADTNRIRQSYNFLGLNLGYVWSF